MPTLIRRLTHAGLEPVGYGADSLAEAALHEPTAGVYTVTNTHHRTRILRMDAHFDRLEASAAHEGIALKVDRPRVRAALRDMIEEAGFGDVRFRLTVPADSPGDMVITLEPFVPPPPDAYARGVRVQTCPDCRRHNPAAKTTGWMASRREIQADFAPGIYEGLLVDDEGRILEGLGSNFYAIVDGTLHTAGEGMLEGIALQTVLRLAPAILPVDRRPVRLADLPRLDEAFISSASRGIVPVVEIDGIQIGDGAPGPFTRALMNAYEAWVAESLEEI